MTSPTKMRTNRLQIAVLLLGTNHPHTAASAQMAPDGGLWGHAAGVGRLGEAVGAGRDSPRAPDTHGGHGVGERAVDDVRLSGVLVVEVVGLQRFGLGGRDLVNSWFRNN